MQSKLIEIAPHIIKIREHLWSGQISGRSAVMVGAGFSFNAESLAVQSASMLSWNGLALKIYEALYPNQNEDKRRSAIAGDGTLKIAQEYETVFGRGALDELIVSSLPDTSFKPGVLHKQLLELPWSDVFTTNYDTLLERASAITFERNYDLVMASQDVARASRPRIVKLHGSFPSQRPFILTEEDFRTYSSKFAPFVNAVQQSMMENVFCLIGFSGEDPNFRFWSGWVRDNLGEAAPKIYLIGLHNYSKSREQLLISKGIIPVDLSPIFESSQFQNEQLRHKAALEWFFASLKNGEAIDIGSWPDVDENGLDEPVYYMDLNIEAPIAGRKRLVLNHRYFYPGDLKEQTDGEKLEKLFREWREMRLTYPGWLIAPARSRKVMWFYTDNFVQFVYSKVHKISSENALLLLRELIWRTDLMLRPMMLDEADKAAKILENLNPFPSQLNSENAKPVADASWVGQFTSTDVSTAWIEVAFAVAKEARDDLDDERFKLWMGRLEKVRQLKEDWQARWYHEQCLYSLTKLNKQDAQRYLREWPETPTRPEWTARRAALLSELDEIGEAGRLAQNALTMVRESIKASRDDHFLLSLESWLLAHLKLIATHNSYSKRDASSRSKFKGLSQRYNRRLKELKTYNCDPQNEIESLERLLQTPMPRVRLASTKTIREPAFELGRITTSHTIGGGSTLEDYIPAFSSFLIAERTGYPLRLSGIRTFEHLDEASRWIWPIAPFWATSTLIRYGKHDSLSKNNWLSNARIASFPQDYISTLFEFALSASNQALENLPIESEIQTYSSEILGDLFELLSKLSFRLTDAQLTQSIQLAVNAYKSFEVQKDAKLHDPLRRLFERCFRLLSSDKAAAVLVDCVNLPIPKVDDMRLEQEHNIQHWLEPTVFLLNNEDDGSITNTNLRKSTIAKLVELVDDVETVRQRAIWRLFALYQAGLLSIEQGELFAKALWSDSKIDQATNLPIQTGLYISSLLKLPEPNPGHAKSTIKKYLTENPLPSIYEKEGGGKVFDFSRIEAASYIDMWSNSAPIPLLTQRGDETKIDWDSDEIVAFVKKVLAWWDTEKGELTSHSIGNYVIAQLQRVDEAVLRVVLSNQNFDRGAIAADLNRFTEECEEQEYAPFASSLLRLDDSNKSDIEAIAHKLLAGLSDGDYNAASRAIDAIVFWQFYAIASQLPMPPADLVDRLIEKILMLENPALERSCFALSKLLREVPESLSEYNFSIIERALKRILKEAKIPSFEEFDAEATTDEKIPLNQRPNMQYAGTELAAALFIHSKKLKLEPTPTVLEWQKIYKNTVFPEIRKINWE